MGFKNILPLLAATLLSLSACSNSDKSLAGNRFLVVSDCVNPVQEVTVTTFANVITTPGLSWTVLGFPQTAVDLISDVSGISGAANRTCKVTYGNVEPDPDEIIYSCFDNGSYACTILIREN